MSELCFYLDESVNANVLEQLLRHGIQAVSARSLSSPGDSDEKHLQRATQMGCVLCTHDPDFIVLATQGIAHAGIAFAPMYGATIGGWVRELRKMHDQITAEEAINCVFYLSVR